jgi:hypothetical protein
MTEISKRQSHGRIGEAAVSAKCWMHGVRAYSTGGLRANFAGSDLIVETGSQRRKLWVQVKTGSPTLKDGVYLTQCNERDVDEDKFTSDFVVYVNLNARHARAHRHDGQLDFSHLTFYVLPVAEANKIFKDAVLALAKRPKRDNGIRKMTNVAIDVPKRLMVPYLDAWHLIREASMHAG